jgi:pilus assembly protein Flp/PilA
MLAYWMTWLRCTLKREHGQGLVEYALIIVLVSIALIAALTLMSGGVESTFSTITDTLNPPAS